MDNRKLWSRILLIAGTAAMLVGAIDPLEGSIIILVGAILLALGTWIGYGVSKVLSYWLWVAFLIALGVAVMWIMSAFGGLGGDTGRSLWWALFILPYPVGWLMGIGGLIGRLVLYIRGKRQ